MHNLSTKFTALKSTRKLIDEQRIKAKKSYGQNFLIDESISDQIVLHAGKLSGETVVEIGPGLGSLTKSILASSVDKVIAVEVDESCIPKLAPIQELAGDRLQIITADALTLDWANLIQKPYSIIANLPYNIATVLITRWLRQPIIKQIIVMIQKEVAQRICAANGDDLYGALSVLIRSSWEPEILFDVRPESFYPQPKVTSSVICLKPLEQSIDDRHFANLEKVCRTAFMHRRKMVKSTLKKLFPDAELLLKSIGIDLNARAEQLSPQDFVKLAGELK
jgi:16S rRNA (adenine1518-N6/adenine1519-N6)-dimethyltransferase